MSGDLFRREVFEARRNTWLGAISLAQPLSLWTLAGFAVLAALAVALFLIFGTYTRRTRVIGQLVPVQGLATVVAPAAGVLSRLAVEEGRAVRAGELLAVVTVPRATLAAGDTASALEARLDRRRQVLLQAQSAQSALLSAQELGLSRQLEAARRQRAQIVAEIATRQNQVRIAQDTLERLRQLHAQRYASELQLRQQENLVLEQTSAVQALQRQAVDVRRQIAQLQQAIGELPAQRQLAIAAHQRELALLEQEQVETRARGELAVTAPIAGVVATQVLKPGQAVQAGQPVLTLIPGDGRLEAELLVPSRAIGFIEPGDRVLLRYQAYPHQKFGHHAGRVARISRSALSPGELGALIGNAQAGEPFYRVTVALARQAVTAYGKPEPLKPGMLLEADILGERRRLFEWVFEPLYSLTGRLAE
ncbi:HlyD family secretion protein [Vulcaniibacterium gelatinicum]|uniref:HlyD family secretion protein n=1 Tax=Vulcaniibacterium gelatinicum TaxID=2598725 RepID=UPI0011CB844B|nr:HlyD family efflux transporter periplasmic adaptor subunit [Vulcaniibacterium gelatinicum]